MFVRYVSRQMFTRVGQNGVPWDEALNQWCTQHYVFMMLVQAASRRAVALHQESQWRQLGIGSVQKKPCEKQRKIKTTTNGNSDCWDNLAGDESPNEGSCNLTACGSCQLCEQVCQVSSLRFAYSHKQIPWQTVTSVPQAKGLAGYKHVLRRCFSCRGYVNGMRWEFVMSGSWWVAAETGNMSVVWNEQRITIVHSGRLLC
jgi:ferredoxin